MLVVNMLVAFITLAYLMHVFACFWYMVACPQHICHNENMNFTIQHGRGKTERL